MNRFLCLLSGGHRYEDKNLKAQTVGEECVITNVCIKCGNKYETRLLWKDILRGEELMEECFEYCENDVLSMEELFKFLKDDSEIITEITEGADNDNL